MDEWKEFKVAQEEVDIATVLLCGQSFRWKKNASDSTELIGVFGHRLWILKQNKSHIQYKVYGEDKNGDGDSKEALDKQLYDYLQLEVSLPALYKKWAEVDTKFKSLTTTDFQGIRILKQEPVENIFSFICSSNNNIQRISQMVEKLCVNYGEKIISLNGQDYFDFPPVEKLVGEEVEKKLREESFGYRAEYIAKTAEIIVENGGLEWVEGLKKLSYEEARRQLRTLHGIGRKVADCICLMSLGFPQAIPVDTHILQVAKEYLPHLAKVRALNEKVYSEITAYFGSIYGDYCGWAHSVLFASTLRHLKTEVPSKQSKKTGKKRKSETNGVEDELQNVTKNESSSMPAVSINSNPINETENRRSKRKK